MSVKIEFFGQTASEAATELKDFYSAICPPIVVRSGPVQTLAGGAFADAAVDVDEDVADVARLHDMTPARVAAETPKPEPVKRTRAKKAEPAPAPVAADPVVAEDEAAQDAEDEAEETAVQAVPEVITLDAIRSVMGQYVKKYGIECAQADGPQILGVKAISMLQDASQDVLRKAHADCVNAVANNPYNRKAV